MKLAAVTACPTGIAHSQMAAESLEQTAEAEGHEIVVEIQGAMGAENELSEDDIATADAVIIAADTSVSRDRFADVPVVKGTVKEGINDPEGLFERAREAASDGAGEGDGGAATAPESDDAADATGEGRSEAGDGTAEAEATSSTAAGTADGETKRAVETGNLEVDPDQVGGDPRKGLLARLKRMFS